MGGELPPRSQGKTPSGKHASKGACQEWCVGDTTCNYYLYRYDPKKNPNYICQRFTSCDSTHSFTQGDGGHIYGKPWSIMATDAYCNKGELPPRSQGKTPSGKHASQGACQEWCVGDTKCNYYLYRYDPKKNPNYICQRFASCDSTHSFTQGDGGHIYG